MKIYVDELPKLCAYCPYYYGNSQGAVCKLTGIMTKWNETLGEMQTKCSLQSLTDHDKQVRKQVCEEIMNIITKKDKKLEKSNYSDSFVSGYNCCYCDVKQILDQIQGE